MSKNSIQVSFPILRHMHKISEVQNIGRLWKILLRLYILVEVVSFSPRKQRQHTQKYDHRKHDKTSKWPHAHMTSNTEEVPKRGVNSMFDILRIWAIMMPTYHNAGAQQAPTATLDFSFFLFAESLLTPRLAPGKPFTGCIRHFVIDGRPVSFSKAALVSGAVSINSCPVAWHDQAQQP